ncbi:hypothetical protein L21_1904 [Methanoculleus chikugoensis]|uniref:Uncharacterized protein n=1 Tax=Methanoculleus chikugoensis TaxID=118126 RepID=A0A1M4MM21_9EURY|nr:hypothetical protein [Methanoculleus chikugoensis]MDD4566583.1 hypothetical protein [Methanoculleus chikugoensis]NMA09525.1 hypothetical protein [Methanomicrobiales archaeon]SCL75984.1 hypothetical protein L21_1904 [Methanoculleus chikugoensis]
MSRDNLVTINKLREDIKAMKLLSLFLKPELLKKLEEMEQQIDNMSEQATLFNSRFSDYGWCAYDSMSVSLMEDANKTFEEHGIEAAEQVLIRYYKTDVKKIVHWIRSSSKSFAVRYDQIGQFFEDHFAERYYASVPLALIIIDGAVNDFTKSKGFFAEGTSVDAWDCLVGCSEGLAKLKDIFYQKRTKTNSAIITAPYRNGILHGRDINYANEHVSCKCVALMFAIADWMKMKDSEEERRTKFEKAANPPPIMDSLARLQENKQTRREIAEWKPRDVILERDIPATGTVEDYDGYPYVVAVVEMFDAWKEKNYGKLSNGLRKMFPSTDSLGKRAGECRELFQHKEFSSFEIIEVEERGCALSKVQVKVSWLSNGDIHKETLAFGCIYESTTDSVGLPWKCNGEWVLAPWDIRGLTS